MRKPRPTTDCKLRYYGVPAPVKQSRMPSNNQIDFTLRYALSHSPVSEPELL